MTLRRNLVQDIGFGKTGNRGVGRRLLNRDGSFNQAKDGIGFMERINPYHSLLTSGWPGFFLILFGLYLATNFIFAWAGEGRATIDVRRLSSFESI